jgi:hypothetical protein
MRPAERIRVYGVVSDALQRREKESLYEAAQRCLKSNSGRTDVALLVMSAKNGEQWERLQAAAKLASAELVTADWVVEDPTRKPSNATITDLIRWSAARAKRAHHEGP